ncbi:hypothetical protein FRC14_007636 [Serendipita sp. 396]|nr:hypothetical protein FRC14_007636 [Serendipita sp. 396]KAG8858058.1 hypothetical protein FRC20_012099 [Serendipita sp. 405]
MKRWIVLSPLAIPACVAFSWSSWSSLFSGRDFAPADQYVVQTPVETYKPALRVAVVGAGAAGSSAALWIHKAAERLEKDIVVDVFERSDYIGGRSTVVYPYNDTSNDRVELGASIYVEANKNMVRAAKEYKLEVSDFHDGDETVGIWDGSQMLVTTGAKNFFGKIWENIRLLWRYGYRSPVTTNALVKQTVEAFLSIYNKHTSWDSVEDLSARLNLTDLTAQDGATYLASQGVGETFAFEVVECATRVNYAQDLNVIHGLGAMVSMAANGAKGITKGNFHVFEHFLKDSQAKVHLNTHVTKLQPKPDGGWVLLATGAAPPTPTPTPADETLDEKKEEDAQANIVPPELIIIETYDVVILAAPFDTLDIQLPTNLAPVTPAPYVNLHVTLLSTKSPTAKHEYFGLGERDTVPTMVLTTAQGIRAGGKAPEFNSLSYHGRIKEGVDEWVVKIFSEERIEDEWLAGVFDHVGWVHRKVWDSYPKLPPTTRYNPMKLSDGLYYVNGFETFISTMETETVASRGVVDLMLKEMLGDGICPSGVSSPPPEGEEFVWGWDC